MPKGDNFTVSELYTILRHHGVLPTGPRGLHLLLPSRDVCRYNAHIVYERTKYQLTVFMLFSSGDTIRSVSGGHSGVG